MTRKSFLTSLVIVVLLIGSAVSTTYVLLRHEPDSYVRAEVPPGPEREARSEEFERKAVDLYTETQCAPDWQAEFTEEQINSYLAEDFPRSKPITLPAGISDPRVILRPGRLILAFRYGDAELSSVVSVHAKVWLPPREPNLIAIEIEQLRAGAMPLAVKVLQDHIEEAARQQKIDVQWYRNGGNPVAIVRLQADRREPTVLLKELDIRAGIIFMKGQTLDPAMRRQEVPTPPSPKATTD